MTNPGSVGQHPGSETLAAFVDGRLRPDDRLAVEIHLGECDACREIVVDAAAMRDEVASFQSRASLASKPGLWIGLAASIVAVIVGWIALGRMDRSADPLQDAVRKLAANMGAFRQTTGRLSGPFSWGPPPSATRGAGTQKPPIEAEQAALEVEKLFRDGPTAASHAAVGMARLAIGDIDAGLAALEEALRLDPNQVDARVDLSAGYLARFHRNGLHEDAARALDAAAAALLRRPDWPAALFNRALALEVLGLRDEAISAWRTYLASRDDPGWKREAEEHLKRLTGSASTSPSPQLSPAMDDAELKTLAVDRPEALETLALDMIATNPQEPRTIAELSRVAASLHLAGRDGFVSDVAGAFVTAPSATRSCLSRGVAALVESRRRFDVSDYRTALTHAQDAARAFECGRAGELEASMQLAWIRFFQGDRESATHAASALVHEARKQQYHRVVSRGSYLVGLKGIGEGRERDGLVAYEAAIHAARLAGSPDLEATIVTARAEAFRLFGDPQSAWTNHAEAMRLLPHLTPRRRHIVVAGASLTASQSRLPAAAVTLAEWLTENSHATGDAAVMVGAHLQLARAWFEIEEFAKAEAAIDVAGRLLTSVSDLSARERYLREADWIGGAIDVREAPERAISRLSRAVESLTSVRRAEVLLARGRAHMKLGQREQALADWRQGIDLVEVQDAQIVTRGLRISRFGRLWDLFAEVIAASLDDPPRALVTAERSRARDLLDEMKRLSIRADLQFPLNWLPDDTVVLYYVSLPDALALWQLERSRTLGVSIPVGARELATRVRAYTTALRESASASSDALIEGLIPTTLPAGVKRIVVVPDGDLHAVPFAALRLPGSNQRLVERHVVMVAPSLSILRAALDVKPDRSRQGGILLIGVDAADPVRSLPRLPKVAEELAALVRLYPANMQTVLSGRTPTASRILAHLPSANVVHFAGHAVADEWFPSKSVFLTAPDDAGNTLTPGDFAGVRMIPGSVVVLSACDTARGRTYRGEGPISLARPFLAAGAGYVVSTLWAVRDDDASRVMADFHGRLARGLRADAALAEAQREAINRGQPAASWSAFEVIGSMVSERSH